MILAAFLAACAVVVLTTSQDRPDAPRPAVGVKWRANANVRLPVPAGWQPSTDTGGIPGLRFAGPLVMVDRAAGLRLVAGILPATSRTLLPAELVESATHVPAALGPVGLRRGFAGLHYAGIVHPAYDGVLDVVVAPTSAGVVTIACMAPDQVRPLLAECTASARRATPLGALPIRVEDDAAFLSRLPSTLRTLETARARIRRDLRSSRTGESDAAALSLLARAHRDAAAELTPLLSGGAATPRRLVRALRAVGASYARLESAARSGREDRYRRALRRLAPAERGLRRHIASFV